MLVAGIQSALQKDQKNAPLTKLDPGFLDHDFDTDNDADDIREAERYKSIDREFKKAMKKTSSDKQSYKDRHPSKESSISPRKVQPLEQKNEGQLLLSLSSLQSGKSGKKEDITAQRVKSKFSKLEIQIKQTEERQESTQKVDTKQGQNPPLYDNSKSLKLIYGKRSLFLFHIKNPIRRFVLKVLEHKDSLSEKNKIMNKISQVLTYIFLTEAFLKILAQGFVLDKNAYLRDGWNIMDFIVVLTGLLDEFLDNGAIKLKSLRVLRVFRPLRSINAVPSMKKLVSALFQSIPDFLNVAVFLLFIFLMFAILGVHQFNGSLYNRCRLTPAPLSPDNWPLDPDNTRACTLSGLGSYQCPSGTYCGNPDQLASLESDNIGANVEISYGIIHFDNLAVSLLTVFQMVTTVDWIPVMLDLMDVEIPFIGAFFSILLVITCSFFLMNLILAVIIQAFIKIQKKELESEILNFQEIKIEDVDIDEENNELQLKVGGSVEVDEILNQIQENEQDESKLNLSKQVSLNDASLLKSPSIQTRKADLSFLKNRSTKNRIINQFTHIKQEKEETKRQESLKHNPVHSKLNNLFINVANLSMQASVVDNTHNLNDSHNNSLIKEYKDPSSIKSSLNESIQYLKVQPQIEEKDLSEQHTEEKQENSIFKQLIKFKKERKSQQLGDQEKQGLSGLLGGFFMKKKQELSSQEQFFNQVLKDAKQDLQSSNQKSTNMRQLVQQKLSIRLTKKNTKLQTEFRSITLDHRAARSKFIKFFYTMIKSRNFQRAITFLIIINTIVLSLDRHPIDPLEEIILDDINFGLSFVFVAEMIFKLIGLGFKHYFLDSFNIFDCVVVVSSIIDFVVTISLQGQQTTTGALTALRAFRLVRVFKLAKSWRKLQNLLKTMMRTLKDVSTFSILLFIFIFIYTLLAMEVFAHFVKFDQEDALDTLDGRSPLANFDDFVNSFTTVFIILTNDGWPSIFFNCYRAVGPAITITFYVTLIVFGQKIMLNLFLAILLENFDEESLSDEIQDQLQSFKNKDRINANQSFSAQLKVFFQKKCRCFRAKKYLSQSIMLDQSQNNNQDGQDDDDQQIIGNMSQKDLLGSSISPIRRKSINKFLAEDKNPLQGISLSVFSQTSKFRQWVHKLVTNGKFDIFIIFVIIVSGVQLACERPSNDPNGYEVWIYAQIDIATTTIFFLESCLKIVAFGFVFNGNLSYLRNGWNILDLVIVMFSIISLTPLPSELKTLKMLRVIRCLRLLNKNEGLQVAVKALIQAIPQILSVTVIMMLFFLIFGIISVSYFKGKFNYCFTDQAQLDWDIKIEHKWECMNLGADWEQKDFSFDNIIEGMRSLFQMATTSGWQDILFTSISAYEIDYEAVQDCNRAWIIFFVIFIIVGSFFMLNLFVGVVISTFNREKDKIGGNHLLTDNQKQWIDARVISIKAEPIKIIQAPKKGIRRICFYIQNKAGFDHFIFGCIVMNTIVLTWKHYREPEALTLTSDILNYIFTLIFTLEAIIRLLAIGKAYFKDSWNTFDFVVVVLSLLSLIITFLSSIKLGGATTIIRAFRIMRVFRLVKKAKSLRVVFNSFIYTLPALANVGGLLLLLLYLYSIIGVILFGSIKRNGILADNLNFETFPKAFVTLFTVATGDSWDQVMKATVLHRSITFQCINDPSYQDFVDNGFQTIGCGLNAPALIFFYSYVMIVVLIFLNLFIAIILQGYEETQLKENKLFNQQTLDKFRDVWSKFDPDATTYIKISELTQLLFALGKPLGWDKNIRPRTGYQQKFIANLDLPIYNNFQDYMFMDVIEALALRLVVLEQLEREKDKMKKEEKDLEDLEMEEEIDRRQKEKEMKEKIKQDLNKLEFTKGSSNIQAVKDLKRIEQRKQSIAVNRIGPAFTSQHQAAANEVIQQMKFMVGRKKQQQQQHNGTTHESYEKQDSLFELKPMQKIIQKQNSLNFRKRPNKNLDDIRIIEAENEQSTPSSKNRTAKKARGRKQIHILLDGLSQGNSSKLNLGDKNDDLINTERANEMINQEIMGTVTVEENKQDFQMSNLGTKVESDERVYRSQNSITNINIPFQQSNCQNMVSFPLQINIRPNINDHSYIQFIKYKLNTNIFCNFRQNDTTVDNRNVGGSMGGTGEQVESQESSSAVVMPANQDNSLSHLRISTSQDHDEDDDDLEIIEQKVNNLVDTRPFSPIVDNIEEPEKVRDSLQYDELSN